MSEDEILKDIDNYISFANKAGNFSDINEYLHCKELARRMKGLLDLYQKEKEKNKKLKNQAKMSAEEHEKTFDRLDKMIDLLIEDMQMEGFLIDMTKEEIYRYYEKRIMLDNMK